MSGAVTWLWRHRIWVCTEKSMLLIVFVCLLVVKKCQLLGQTFRHISSNQLLANYFSIHSQHSEKEEDRGGLNRSLDTTINTTTTAHHHNHPPPLLPPIFYGWKGGGRKEGRNYLRKLSRTHTRTYSKIGREQKLTINVMGWLLPPHSSGTRPAHQCGKNGQLHLENRKMRLVKKLNTITDFFSVF